MDFKPYSEYVLPPERGVPVDKLRGEPGNEGALAPPRQYHLPADLILVLDEDHAAICGAAAPREVTLHTAAAETACAPREAAGEWREPADPPEVAAPPAAGSDAGPAGAAGDERNRPDAHDHHDYRDYIIAYEGQFVAHYRTSRRVTNRTAFKRVVERLRESVPDLDTERLELFKPVPVKVDREACGQAATESFRWFAPGGER